MTQAPALTARACAFPARRRTESILPQQIYFQGEHEMSSTQTRRIKPDVLQADLDAQVALAGMTDYKPANANYSAANVATALAALQAAQQAELRAQVALETARDAAAAAEWRFHETMLAVKDQVIAQYGKSSDQLQALGLKKKMEYKRPAARAAQAR
jgi:hypothetical protein